MNRESLILERKHIVLNILYCIKRNLLAKRNPLMK